MITDTEVRVRSTDMDADGIVNNARYFEFFEQGRLEHLVAIGLVQRPRPPGAPARSFTIAETTCRYRAPTRHRDVLRVRTWTQEVRNRSFVLAYEIVRAGDGATVAEGSSAQVWLDAEGRPAALDDSARALLVRSADAATAARPIDAAP
ncbi:MAG: thioesterase family protein [Dehalococcoidia bacterium]